MAVFQAEYTEAQTKQVVVAGVPDKIIVVTKITFTSVASATFTLLSDPNGAAERTVLVKQHSFSSGFLDLALGRRYGLPADRGKDLAITTQITGPTYLHAVIIWYELVD